jgi:hypothetical protein
LAATLCEYQVSPAKAGILALAALSPIHHAELRLIQELVRSFDRS